MRVLAILCLTPLLPLLEDHCYPAGSRFESSLGYTRPAGAQSFAEAYPLPRTWSVTPHGLSFTGPASRAKELDRVTDKTLACLRLPSVRSFRVIVASNWTTSCDGKEQVLPMLAPSAGCLAKAPATGGCKCHWRAGVREPDVVITTPNLLLYPDALTRLQTGSANPWADSSLIPCLGPWTGPRDGS